MNDDASTTIDESDKSDETMSSSRNAQPRNTAANRKKKRHADESDETATPGESAEETAPARAEPASSWGDDDAIDTSEVDDSDPYSFASSSQTGSDADGNTDAYAESGTYETGYAPPSQPSLDASDAGTWIEAYRKAVDHELTPQQAVDRSILSYKAPEQAARSTLEQSSATGESETPNAVVPLEPVSGAWPKDTSQSPYGASGTYTSGQGAYDRQASIEDVGPLVPIKRPAEKRAAPLGTMLAGDRSPRPRAGVADAPVLSLDRRESNASQDEPSDKTTDDAISLVRRLPPLDAVAPSPYAYDAGLSADAPIPYYPATGR
ncbi:MAG: hypothetical protein D6741_13435 [Planctomycetota bacterium]|nr:MAG: hypothetical protein D6741_13435 [Planctomycetota bacterium]